MRVSKNCFLLTLLFVALPAIYQEDIVIFKEDKPDIKLLWSRMAYFSPTLRSVEAAEFSPNGKYVASAVKFGSYFVHKKRSLSSR